MSYYDLLNERAKERKLKEERDWEILEMYSSGITQKEIAEKLGLTAAGVLYILRKYGAKPSPRGDKKERFTKALSEDLTNELAKDIYRDRGVKEANVEPLKREHPIKISSVFSLFNETICLCSKVIVRYMEETGRFRFPDFEGNLRDPKDKGELSVVAGIVKDFVGLRLQAIKEYRETYKALSDEEFNLQWQDKVMRIVREYDPEKAREVYEWMERGGVFEDPEERVEVKVFGGEGRDKP